MSVRFRLTVSVCILWSVAFPAVHRGAPPLSCATVNLAPFFNNDGVAPAAKPDDGAFDGVGAFGEGTFNYLADEMPAANARLEIGGVPFQFGDTKNGARNNVWTQGQVIPVPR